MSEPGDAEQVDDDGAGQEGGDGGSDRAILASFGEGADDPGGHDEPGQIAAGGPGGHVLSRSRHRYRTETRARRESQ